MQCYQVFFIYKRQSLRYDRVSELVVRLHVSQILCMNPIRIRVCILDVHVLHEEPLYQKSFEFETIWKWRVRGRIRREVLPENCNGWAESAILGLILKKSWKMIRPLYQVVQIIKGVKLVLFDEECREVEHYRSRYSLYGNL